MFLGKIKINTKLAEEFNEWKHMYDLESKCTKLPYDSDKQSTYDTDKGKAFSFNFNTATTSDDEFLISKKKDDLILIKDNLYISNEATAENQDILAENEITHAINLVANEESKVIQNITYFKASLRDNPEFDILQTWKDVVAFIDDNEKQCIEPKFVFYWK